VDNYIGIICSQTSPYEIVKRAIDDASFMCTRKYGDAPEVIISGRLEQTFPYVPTHLRKYKPTHKSQRIKTSTHEIVLLYILMVLLFLLLEGRAFVDVCICVRAIRVCVL
jgi:hypothetical protein